MSIESSLPPSASASASAAASVSSSSVPSTMSRGGMTPTKETPATVPTAHSAFASAASSSPPHVKLEVAQYTPGGVSSATASDFKELGDVLLADDLSMLGCDVEQWSTTATATSRPTPTPTPAPTMMSTTRPQLASASTAHAHASASSSTTTPSHGHGGSRSQAFFAAPPVQLTRHASLPVSMMRSSHHFHPHHAAYMAPPPPPPTAFLIPTTMAPPPPSLARQRTTGYIMQAPTGHMYAPTRLVAYHHHPHPHHPMAASPMAMHAHAAHQGLSLSVSQQFAPPPMIPHATTVAVHKKPTTSATSESVEPIAFNGYSDARMSLGEIDSLALAVLSEKDDKRDGANNGSGNTTNNNEDDARASTTSSLGCAQDLENALDSLEKLLPDMDPDLAELMAPPPQQHLHMPNHMTPRAGLPPTGRHALPLLMSPHLKTMSSPSAAVAMMLGSVSLQTPTSLSTPRASPRSLATCKVAGCDRRVRSKGFCKTHGGGRKCSIEGCKKSSQNGDFCIGHGGGKKCKHEGCAKAAQSHGLCKAHGGGARCKYPDCNKSSQGGGLCRAHGGGKRCQAAGCPKGAQRGNFCATHGGFRNCKIEGCVRTDRGGGFCEVHRRGRLCKIDGCKKLARNQGMCTMHIREEKQDELTLPGASAATSPVHAMTAEAVAGAGAAVLAA